MGHLEDIQTILKPLKKNRKKIEIHFYDHFRTSWIIQKNEPAWLGPTVIERKIKFQIFIFSSYGRLGLLSPGLLSLGLLSLGLLSCLQLRDPWNPLDHHNTIPYWGNEGGPFIGTLLCPDTLEIYMPRYLKLRYYAEIQTLNIGI